MNAVPCTCGRMPGCTSVHPCPKCKDAPTPFTHYKVRRPSAAQMEAADDPGERHPYGTRRE